MVSHAHAMSGEARRARSWEPEPPDEEPAPDDAARDHLEMTEFMSTLTTCLVKAIERGEPLDDILAEAGNIAPISTAMDQSEFLKECVEALARATRINSYRRKKEIP